jgi:hypothetical protein
MQITKLTNISEEDVTVMLKGGNSLTLPPKSTIQNVAVENTEQLTGKVQFVKDLTEVVRPGGKMRLDGRAG